MCGDTSNMLGHTRLKRWVMASSNPKPYTPKAMCLTAQHAVCLCTRSLHANTGTTSKGPSNY